jgi:hypothetical protein
VVTLPRTIRAVRAALPAERRAEFAAELEDGDVAEVFNRWWLRAIVYASPETMTELAKVKAGTWRGVPAEEVFGERWTAAV